MFYHVEIFGDALIFTDYAIKIPQISVTKKAPKERHPPGIAQ